MSKTKKETDPLDALLPTSLDSSAIPSETQVATDANPLPKAGTHASRIALVAGYLHETNEHCTRWFEDDAQQNPPESVLNAMTDLLVSVSTLPLVPWPVNTWPFLVHANRLAEAILARGPAWRDPRQPWMNTSWAALEKMTEFIPSELSPTAVQPTIRELESIEQLDREKLSNMQIAKIYNWYNTLGEPDKARVIRAREGKEKPPTQIVIPVEQSGGPRRQPSLDSVDRLLEDLQSARDRMEEQVAV